MTNRRSLQTNMQRISRAQQFVPGHVGGRVASAQPVRERLKVGAAAGPPGAVPDAMARIALGGGFRSDPDPIDVNLSGGAALVVMFGRLISDLVAPAGWTVMEEFTTLSGIETCPYLVASITDADAGTHTFSYTETIPSNIHSVAVVGYELVGATGGSWTAVHGEEIVATFGSPGIITFASPPAAAAAWQETTATSVYTGLSAPVPSGMASGDGEGSVSFGYCWPKSTSAADFASTGTFQGTGAYYNYGSAGAYGTPSSVAFAFGWNA